ncbi:hypothetical protein ACFSR7_31480 [Cohnella sp. GCM10020058]|uniref:hypothetical protein n=1 Tax=Cohnella sp. GCM10020058 TaxID=3317330 RepID=UPI0036344AC2
MSLQNATPATTVPLQGIGGEVNVDMMSQYGTGSGMTKGDFQLFKARTKKMETSFIRLWTLFHWFNPTDGTANYESSEMQAVYKYLDFYQSIGANVLLQQLSVGDRQDMYPWLWWTNDDAAGPGADPVKLDKWATLLKPGEEAVFELRIPHAPLAAARAGRLAHASFDDLHRECAAYWRAKLDGAARIRLPERRIEEMVQAGLLHLDLATYGREPAGTLVPTIGHYTAIGSESAPIIQFMDSLGLHAEARRAIRFFFDKQQEDGFIQNFNGYMLETGAVLWTVGEHFRYTRDERWLTETLPEALLAYRYLVDWRRRNSDESHVGGGYGMLDGKVADPEDPFHSFMLNGYAYMGMRRLAELLRSAGHALAGDVEAEASACKSDIRAAFKRAMALSPAVPIGDGTWVPTAPPWVENRGPMALYADGHGCVTHGSVFTRDALLGPLYLAFQEVLAPNEQATEFLLQFHSELTHSRHVALSQPYYSIHPWLHLKRGEVKAFLKAYTTASRVWRTERRIRSGSIIGTAARTRRTKKPGF